MSGFAKRFMAEFFRFHQPQWQRAMPRRLRLAAQWQFGTIPLAAIVLLASGAFGLAAMLAVFSGFLFLFTGGWSAGERIKSPIGWWATVILFSAMGAVSVVALAVSPP